MERVQRWREPAVVVVVVVLLGRLVLGTAFALGVGRAGGASGAEAADLASRQMADPMPYLVLSALVLACHLRPATRHARTLAALALGVSGVGLLLVLGLAVHAQPSADAPLRHLDRVDRLADAVVPLLAVLLLVLLAVRPRGTAAEQPSLPDQATTLDPEPEAAAPDPALQPTWSPDTASGAAWTTAGEAASGRPASGWGTPAGTGWGSPHPAPAPAGDQPDPDQGNRGPEPGDAGTWARPRP